MYLSDCADVGLKIVLLSMFIVKDATDNQGGEKQKYQASNESKFGATSDIEFYPFDRCGA